MNYKVLKILLIISAIILFFSGCVFATDSTADEFSTNVTSTNETSANEIISEADSSADSALDKVATVTTLSNLPEANLGLNNILNILLITVGVLLILFAIAILIRLKK